MKDNKTAHLKLPLPDGGNRLEKDVQRIMDALNGIDAFAQNSKAEMEALDKRTQAGVFTAGEKATQAYGLAEAATAAAAAAARALAEKPQAPPSRLISEEDYDLLPEPEKMNGTLYFIYEKSGGGVT